MDGFLEQIPHHINKIPHLSQPSVGNTFNSIQFVCRPLEHGIH